MELKWPNRLPEEVVKAGILPAVVLSASHPQPPFITGFVTPHLLSQNGKQR